MRKTIGCYHAHHSNIEYIEKALEPYDVELVHFVDPGLDRQKHDKCFNEAKVQLKIADTLDWIISCRVDALLVTCTYFTANMPGEEALAQAFAFPVITIDEPMFEQICADDQLPLLVFTNPVTVEGTVSRLQQYAERKGTKLPLQIELLEHTFELMMQGNKQAYVEKAAAGLERLAAAYPDRRLWAAQLSMVPAAERASEAAADGRTIGSPLEAVKQELVNKLELAQRRS
jgi:hypothetical protein